jgi:hypothetical protein
MEYMPLVVLAFAGLLLLIASVCYLSVIIAMFKNGKAMLAVSCLLTAGCGGPGVLIAFIYGWVKSGEWQLQRVMRMWTMSIVGVPVLLVLAVIGAGGIGTRASSTFSMTAMTIGGGSGSPRLPGGAADFTMTAQELYSEYSKGGQDRYKFDGKVIELSGIVDYCGIVDKAAAIVFKIENPESPLVRVGCVPKEPDCWARYGAGQKIKVRGKWDPSRGIWRAGLVEAEVQEAEPNPTVLYAMPQFAKDYEDDQTGFLERYKDNHLIFEGEVAAEEKGFPFTNVDLKGSDKISLRCQFKEEEQPAPKVGDKVKVYGKFRYIAGQKSPELVDCLLITGATTAQPPKAAPPRPDPLEAAVKDSAAVVAMIDKAGADVKLAPVDFTLAGVEFTMMAPEGSKIEVSFGRVREVKPGTGFENRFGLGIDVGPSNLIGVQKQWLADKDLRSLAIATNDTLLGTYAEEGKPKARLRYMKTLGHVDIAVWNIDSSRWTFGKPHSIDDGLLMLKCARSIVLKPGYKRPENIAALGLERGITVKRDDKDGAVTVSASTEVCDSMIDYIVKEVPNVEKLSIWSPLTDAGVAKLAPLKQLRELSISFDLIGAGIDGSSLSALRGMTNLESLSLSGTQIPDAALINLRACTRLKRLWITKTPITGSSFRLLKSLGQLENLFLNETNFEDANLVHLAAFKHLRWLNLQKTRITGPGLAHLKALPELDYLDLGGTKIDDSGVAGLKDLSKLTSLDLSDTKVTDACLDTLMTLKLKSFRIARTKITKEAANKAFPEAFVP